MHNLMRKFITLKYAELSHFNTPSFEFDFSGYSIDGNIGRILNQKSADEVMFAKRNIILQKNDN